MAQGQSDNTRVNTAKDIDDRRGVVDNGVFRVYENIGEVYQTNTLYSRFEGQQFPVRRADTVDKIDIYWFEGQLEVLSLFKPNQDLTVYYTKTESDNRYSRKLRFDQAIASALWEIEHDASDKVTVKIYNVDKKEVFADVLCTSNIITQIFFSSPQAGYAIINY